MQVFPDLTLSEDEEDAELDTAVENMVTDCQVGTVLHYCLTSLQSKAPQSGHAATSDSDDEMEVINNTCTYLHLHLHLRWPPAPGRRMRSPPPAPSPRPPAPPPPPPGRSPRHSPPWRRTAW